VDVKSVFGLQETLRVVARSRLFVAIFSHEYFENDVCWKELQTAVLMQKPILFLRDSSYTLPPWLPSHWNAIVRQMADCIVLCDPIYLKECANLVSQVYHDATQSEIRRKVVHASDIRTELMLAGFDHLLMKELPPITTVTPSAVAAAPVPPAKTTYSSVVSVVMKPAPDFSSLEAYRQYLYGSSSTTTQPATQVSSYKVDSRDQSLADYLGIKGTEQHTDANQDTTLPESRPSVSDIMAKVDAYIMEDTHKHKDDDDWTSSESEAEEPEPTVEEKLPEELAEDVKEPPLEVVEEQPAVEEEEEVSASVPQDEVVNLVDEVEVKIDVVQEDNNAVQQIEAPSSEPSMGFFLPAIDDDFDVDAVAPPDMPSQESGRPRVSSRISQLQDKIKFNPAMFATTGRPLKPNRIGSDDEDDDDDDDLDDEDTPAQAVQPPPQPKPAQLASLTKTRAVQSGKKLPSRKPRSTKDSSKTASLNENQTSNSVSDTPKGATQVAVETSPVIAATPVSTTDVMRSRRDSQPPKPVLPKEDNLFVHPQPAAKEPEEPKVQSKAPASSTVKKPVPSSLLFAEDFDFTPKSRTSSTSKKTETRSSLFDTTNTLFGEELGTSATKKSAAPVKLFDDDDLFGSDTFLKADANKTKKKPAISLFDE